MENENKIQETEGKNQEERFLALLEKLGVKRDDKDPYWIFRDKVIEVHSQSQRTYGGVYRGYRDEDKELVLAPHMHIENHADDKKRFFWMNEPLFIHLYNVECVKPANPDYYDYLISLDKKLVLPK